MRDFIRNQDTRHAINILRGGKHMIQHFGWTQRAGARDATGYPIATDREDATCFCTTGAISRASYELVQKHGPKGSPLPARSIAIDAMVKAIIMPDDLSSCGAMARIQLWNDTISRSAKHEVVEAFDKAIAILEEELA